MKAWLPSVIYLFLLGGITDISRKIFGDEQPWGLTTQRRHFGQNVWLCIATSDPSRQLADISWKGV